MRSSDLLPKSPHNFVKVLRLIQLSRTRIGASVVGQFSMDDCQATKGLLITAGQRNEVHTALIERLVAVRDREDRFRPTTMKGLRRRAKRVGRSLHPVRIGRLVAASSPRQFRSRYA